MIKYDINRAEESLNKALGLLLHQFYSVNIGIKTKLLHTTSLPINGCCLWINRFGASANLWKMVVSYQCGLKEALGFLKHFSKHYACNVLNCPTFEHLIIFQAWQIYNSMKNRDSSCLMLWFRRFSYMKRSLDHMFLSNYQIPDI